MIPPKWLNLYRRIFSFGDLYRRAFGATASRRNHHTIHKCVADMKDLPVLGEENPRPFTMIGFTVTNAEGKKVFRAKVLREPDTTSSSETFYEP